MNTETHTYKSVPNTKIESYEKSFPERKTNISEPVLRALRNIARLNNIAIILRPINPIAFVLMKEGAVGKNMFVHGKSAEKGLAKGNTFKKFN